MFCANCGSTNVNEVCLLCGTPTREVPSLDVVSPILAGWWSRVAATLIDSVILIAPTLLLVLLLGNLFGAVAAVAAQAAYLIVLLTTPEGQTLGNRVAQTRVRDALTGHTISRRQATIRWALIGVYGVLGTLPGAGSGGFAITVAALALVDGLSPLWSPRHQTLHDRLAHTIVVRT